MHPEIRQDYPGNCPKCGMSLEPEMPALDDDENPELTDFKRRFWWTLPFTVVVVILAMAGHGAGCFDGLFGSVGRTGSSADSPCQPRYGPDGRPARIKSAGVWCTERTRRSATGSVSAHVIKGAHMTLNSKAVPINRRIAGTLHTRRYVHPIPERDENPAMKKAEESEVADLHRDSEQQDHKDVR